jgi:hypothetical protein
LSSRNPASDSVTRQFRSLIADEVISNFPVLRGRDFSFQDFSFLSENLSSVVERSQKNEPALSVFENRGAGRAPTNPRPAAHHLALLSAGRGGPAGNQQPLVGQFVVPPSGGIVGCRSIPRRQAIPPEGGTTN